MLSTKQAVFQLNGEDYGLDIAEVSTVEKDVKIEAMNNSPKNVKGKIHLRGEEIPVYSLRRKFGFEEKQVDTDTRYLISMVKGKNIAFEVDHVKGIIDIEPSDIFDVPSVIKCNNTSYIKYIANINDSFVLLMDSSKLLDDEEIKALETKVKN